MGGISTDKEKLRTYRTFKNKRLVVEKYLLTPGYYRGRKLMSEIRVGTNQLEVDLGRREGKSREMRFCKQCNLGIIEDELHFITQCSRYSNLRDSLFSDIRTISQGKWQVGGLSNIHQFILMMNGSG